MNPPSRERPPRLRWGTDSTIAALLLLVFGAAFFTALEWSRSAAIYPLGVTGLAAILSAGYVVRSIWVRAKRVDPADEADGDLDETEYVFATASRRDWVTALGYVAGFFLAITLLGLYLATALLCVAYLRHQAATSWRASLIYAAVTTAALYGIFNVALNSGVPGGVLTALLLGGLN